MIAASAERPDDGLFHDVTTLREQVGRSSAGVPSGVKNRGSVILTARIRPGSDPKPPDSARSRTGDETPARTSRANAIAIRGGT